MQNPVHCAERDGDKGGNSRLVMFPGQKQAVNLHTVWDTHLLRDAMKPARTLDYGLALDKEITVEQRKAWGQGTPTDWANEAHRIAVENAYAGVPKDGAPPSIERQYIVTGQAAVEEQLKRAGVRLAFVLNGVFADHGAPAAALPPALFKHWIHSHEDVAEGVKAFRRKGYEFPPTRGTVTSPRSSESTT